MLLGARRTADTITSNGIAGIMAAIVAETGEQRLLFRHEDSLRRPEHLFRALLLSGRLSGEERRVKRDGGRIGDVEAGERVICRDARYAIAGLACQLA